MRSFNRKWAIWILVVLLVITGCSSTNNDSSQDQEKLKKTLKEWESVELKMAGILDGAEEKEFNEFQNEFRESFGHLLGLHESFGELITETKDPELKKIARVCGSEMTEVEEDAGLIYCYYRDYFECKELRGREDIVIDESKDMDVGKARNRYVNQVRLYKKQRFESGKKIVKSGL